MKPVTTFFFLLLAAIGFAQEKNIDTQSVSLENLIPFIAENYSKNSDSQYNITFLIQVRRSGVSRDDKIVFKQAFKLFSKRLNDDDLISIIAYDGLNGIALEKESSQEIKSILFAINNIKKSIDKEHNDGIELAYTYADENYIDEAQNVVIMVRNPTASTSVPDIATTSISTEQTTESKPKNNAVLLTAITLLPELISIIKD